MVNALPGQSSYPSGLWVNGRRRPYSLAVAADTGPGFASVGGYYRLGGRGIRNWSLRIHSSMRSGHRVTGSLVGRKPYPCPPLS